MKISYPLDSFQISSPEDLGFDKPLLNQAVEYAMTRQTDGLVILRHGKMVLENYSGNWTPSTSGPVYSATKSITAFLFGMALKDQAIPSLDTPVNQWISEWQDDPRGQITVRHLMSMASGLRCSFAQDFQESREAASEFNYALGLKVDHEPRQVWDYNNTAYRMLYTLLERATGTAIDDYARNHLAMPLGMQQFSWGLRPTADARNPQFVECSTRDMARFGLLCLSQGQWHDEQLIDTAFVQECLTPSQQDNSNYGLLWWLNCGEQWKMPYKNKPYPGPLFPDCPRDTVAALGFKDNKVYVVPSLGLVVARLGNTAVKVEKGQPIPDLTMSGFDNPFLSMLVKAIKN